MTQDVARGSEPAWRRRPLGTVGVLGLGLLAAVLVLALVLALVAPAQFGLLLAAAAVGLVGVLLGLRSPVLACVYLLVATFFRLAIPSNTLPVDPFLIAFVGVLASTWLWMTAQRRRFSAEVDPIVCTIALYLTWNLLSMVVRHPYPPGPPLARTPFPVERFVLIGIAMPLVMFVVGRWVFITSSAIRVLLWTVVGASAYSAFVSIAQFVAPSLVWPRYIVTNPLWEGRANGVFNQPVVNGLILIVGFLVAVLIASHRVESRLLRAFAAVVAAASAYAVYLTHTRAVWLAFFVVVVLGAVAGRGFRTGYVATLVLTALAVARYWSVFTSSDRSAGGVGSVNEVQDRLNTFATSIWAFEKRPWTGWGIGRFPAVNTFHHQQYSPEVPWQRGFGIASHLDALGILAELGIVGLALWGVLLVLLYTRLVRATRLLPSREMYGRSLGLIALMCLLAQSITSLTVDLRFFDFPNIIVMLLAGAVIGLQRQQQQQVREVGVVPPTTDRVHAPRAPGEAAGPSSVP